MESAIVIFFVVIGSCLYLMIKCLDKKIDAAFELIRIHEGIADNDRAVVSSLCREMEAIELLRKIKNGEISESEAAEEIKDLKASRDKEIEGDSELYSPCVHKYDNEGGEQ